MALANDKVFQMRVSEDFLRNLDDWRRAQADLPGRSEAIRRLVEFAIAVESPLQRVRFDSPANTLGLPLPTDDPAQKAIREAQALLLPPYMRS